MNKYKAWYFEAWRRWPKACWISGNGPYALLAHCDVLTVTLWSSLEETVIPKRMIDIGACGGKCRGPQGHEIVKMTLESP